MYAAGRGDESLIVMLSANTDVNLKDVVSFCICCCMC